MMKKTTIIKLIILMLAFFYANELRSEENEGWEDSLSVSAGLEWYKGTTNLINYYYSFSYMASHKNEWDVDFSIEGNYAETEKRKSINEHYMGLTFDRWFFGGDLAADYLGSIETNQIQNVYSRTIAGIGPKYRPLHIWWIEFYMLTLPIIDHTRTYELLESDIIYRQHNEASLTFYFTKEQTNRLQVKYTYIPNWENRDDYRTELLSEMTLNIVDIFYLTVTFKQTYVSKPYETEEFEVKKTNYSTIVSLGIEI